MTHQQTPLGEPVPDWTPPPRPDFGCLEGRYARLERLDPARHAAALHKANRADAAGRIWRYLPYGPFDSLEDYRVWAAKISESGDPMFFAIIDRETGLPGGVAAYLRIAPEAGSIEVGHINLAPRLQRTPAATEAIFLMMDWAFDAGYRRFEWKCDALNARSRSAALRYGFTFEGVFRQAAVVKGRNRDTAWYAVIDKEWPALSAALEAWLAPGNFDGAGRQRAALSELTGAALDSFRGH